MYIILSFNCHFLFKLCLENKLVKQIKVLNGIVYMYILCRVFEFYQCYSSVII